ncbi:hypothetical protein GGR50DRAFT_146062 [Xylaria sp. CBS 124048]|nr:hypothetical protein GGR50DRAFT_146062 [Xylaria sp. CBS 124048]
MESQQHSAVSGERVTNNATEQQPSGENGKAKKLSGRKRLLSDDPRTQRCAKVKEDEKPPQAAQGQSGTAEVPSDSVDTEIQRPRDLTTGRMLSEWGRACLRCLDKSLICTLTFAETERERQCAACRRSKLPYCVRIQTRGPDGRAVIPYVRGPPWGNPNFIAGTMNDRTPQLSRDEIAKILREYYEGTSAYVLGTYVSQVEAENFVFPTYQGFVNRVADEKGNPFGRINAPDALPLLRQLMIDKTLAKMTPHARKQLEYL